VTRQQSKPVTNDELVLRYEQLRLSAVGADTATASRRWGPSLLIRCGMAGWMLAQSVLTCERGRDDPRPVRPQPTGLGLAQAELVVVLTDLILKRCRERANV